MQLLAGRQLGGSEANSLTVLICPPTHPRAAGPVPPALITGTALYSLNLAHNRLNGSLAWLGQALAAASGANTITTFNLSGNQLAGELPASLQHLALFSARDLTRFTLGGRWSSAHPPPMLLDLSGNRLVSDFPAFVLELLPAAECRARGCTAWAALSGPDMQLRCPARQGGARYSAEQLELLRPMHLECVADGGKRVHVVDWLTGGSGRSGPSAAGGPSGGDGDSGDGRGSSGGSSGAGSSGPGTEPAARQDGGGGRDATSGGGAAATDTAVVPLLVPVPAPTFASAPGSPSSGMIAGLAIGLTSGLALSAALVYFVGYKRLLWTRRRYGGSMDPLARVAAGASAYMHARHNRAFGSRAPLPKLSDDSMIAEVKHGGAQHDSNIYYVFSREEYQADSRAAYV